jgi:hypothetical protein
MRAVAREAAFEQDEVAHVERIRREAAHAFEESGDLVPAPALPSRKRDVRMKGAALRIQADGEAGALDLRRKRGNERPRLDTGPQSARAALLEPAGAGDAKLERRGADAGELGGEIVRDRPLDLSNEA